MALHKKFLKTKAECKVQFVLTEEETSGAASVYLVGDFNDWETASLPMAKRKNGTFFVELSLPMGRDYQFRYLLDSGEWVNEADADAYVPSPFAGTDNSVLKT
jgi:1,4-alpha-glucan branching enzyme